MIKILKIGENALHDSTFIVNRPLGHPAYLLLLIKLHHYFSLTQKVFPAPPLTIILINVSIPFPKTVQ